MMAKLILSQNSKVLVPNLKVAEGTFARMKGLLGTAGIEESDGLWIQNCYDVHTFFMNYSIDCIFLDEKLVVHKVVENLKPFRLAFSLGARSVVEVKAGFANKMKIKPGDQLYVGD